MTDQHLIAVIGAGPAGLFGARELAQSGARVVLFNRDLKPGGLAEYGIYPTKIIMKSGLRKQFHKILDNENIDYYGNITIGTQADLSLDDLKELGFQAILVTAGAQGAKWLGLPGEDLSGVYQAKDVVFYYNKLPPYSQDQYLFGKRCAIVGAGNVMLDVARYLIRQEQVEEVIAVVRRGPAEIKFDKKEMEFIISNLDQTALDKEIARVRPIMESVSQDPEAAHAKIMESLPKAFEKVSDTRFRFEFLSSPLGMLGKNGTLTQLEIEDTTLILKDGNTKARGTGNKRLLEVDTVVFAIGDKVDESFGLPTQWSEFVKNENPKFPMNDISYEAFNPETNTPIEGIFVGGWSRKASEGLVGYARKDGIRAAKAVMQYLEPITPDSSAIVAVKAKIKSLNKPAVTKDDLQRLVTVEAQEAEKLGEVEFKFSSNEEMLGAMGLIVAA
ncbi:MAG: FAD-dependent oxidoreductase [Anaerolineae bacterium]|nr:FAD-dependent oxidoreductase [Anaerolineae bacterium]